MRGAIPVLCSPANVLCMEHCGLRSLCQHYIFKQKNTYQEFAHRTGGKQNERKQRKLLLF